MSTIQKDDDLLILSDDADTIDFGATESQQVAPKKNDLDDDFSFTFEEDETPVKVEEPLETTSSAKISLSDLSKEVSAGDTEKSEESEKIDNSLLDFDLTEEKKGDTSEESLVDLGSFSESVSIEKDNKKELKPLENIGDMSDILTRAIGEFEQREHLIEDNISEKENHISSLEEELTTEKTLVSELKNEKNALEKNRKSLEQMKKDFQNKNS
ncbi:hypothetical protein BLD25_02830 [Candidatus Gracilibacteria bacterium GN02-872]|nr:hypothetical protein BLD25_02830 [Candidatus Gracilibacteria bacterium GN02-872]